MTEATWSIGSQWLRWDPHLHAPGTLLNDQFGGDWDEYIQQIENAQPAPSSLGITDYFTLRTYKEVRKQKQAGALQDIPLIFPNVELRLTIETKDRSGINLHLLVCPDDNDHIAKIEEWLSRLRFRFGEESYSCTDDGLVGLGRAHRRDSTLLELAALTEGANQFKVELGDLRKLYEDDPWFRNNVLIAVAAGKDGLGGISNDASFRAQREELGRFSQVVFSGNPTDRSYWLGKHPDFIANGQQPKPCLHGSDAHGIDSVLQPDKDRRCWIRAEPTFDGLRQTLVEPERRVHIGADPPASESPGNVIRSITLHNAPWLSNDELLLNDGLVTIIGAKGSGKTALVDLLAFAADNVESQPGPASFIEKAGKLIHGVKAELEWNDGIKQSATVPRSDDKSFEARVRYLSQQFVERLCSHGGLTDPLVEEIERVVFNAIPEEDRLECSTFAELRTVLLENSANEQHAVRETIRTKTQLVAEEIILQRSVPALRAKEQDAVRHSNALKKAINDIPLTVSDKHVKAQQAVALKVQALKTAIAAEERRTQNLRDVAADLNRQLRAAVAAVNELESKYPSLLSDENWKLLQLGVSDDAIPTLERLQQVSQQRATTLRDHGLSDQAADESNVPQQPVQTQTSQGLDALEAENKKLTDELGLDREKAQRRADFVKRHTTAAQAEQQAKKNLTHAKGAKDRKLALHTDRLNSYQQLFDALASEEEELTTLYQPLRDRIAADARLQKLSLKVQRVVDVDAWAVRGESLLDLRRPPFQRRGVLAEHAGEELLGAWQSGSPSDARDAMKGFVDKFASKAMEALAQGCSPCDFGDWLFSTDHICIRYGLQYEEVDVAHLSPGTKGVVLLTLYLGLDEWDHRPLVIDQPEENLDPRSVYTDLVPFFRDAARRRQIIMVTHNANLVVNTDSDQVIVASAERVSPHSLPKITYCAGGLEDPQIREHVCSLLEGGKDAFMKRGQRYGTS